MVGEGDGCQCNVVPANLSVASEKRKDKTRRSLMRLAMSVTQNEQGPSWFLFFPSWLCVTSQSHEERDGTRTSSKHDTGPREVTENRSLRS